MSLVEKSLKIHCNPKLKVLLLNQEEGREAIKPTIKRRMP